jgi:hypothetical protein
VDRLLIIDADLNPRIAGELRKRGRAARSLQHEGLKDLEDPAMLRAVYAQYEDPVVVTSDDDMPLLHAAEVAELDATLAVIEPWERHPESVIARDDTTSMEETYEREIIHRWCQTMQGQARGSVRRYFLSGGYVWTPRK